MARGYFTFVMALCPKRRKMRNRMMIPEAFNDSRGRDASNRGENLFVVIGIPPFGRNDRGRRSHFQEALRREIPVVQDEGEPSRVKI